MGKKKNNIFWTVLTAHVGAVLLLIILPMLQNCTRKKPKEPIVFVDLVTDQALQEVAAPPKIIDPTPEPEPEPTPDPTPEPEPEEPIPEPEPKKPKWKPEKVEVQKKRITKKASTPKSKPTPRPRVTADSLKNSLSEAISAENAYGQTIYTHYYPVWRQPTSALVGSAVSVEIRVEKSGRVSANRILIPSGNATLDQSVQHALNSVSHLPAPPASLAGTWIQITFVVE